jgi:hypothetical protein
MPLNKKEKILLEAVQNMLQQDVMLGLSIHKNTDDEEYLSAERGYEYLHNQIDEMFSLKAAEITHTDGVCQAFRKVHSYKYLDDPSFKTAMQKEMVAQGIPKEDREKAIDWIPQIIKELKEEQSEWSEKDFGFHPQLDEIKETSQPEQPMDFDIEDVDGWSMKSNVKWKRGEASPGHTPDEAENTKNRLV